MELRVLSQLRHITLYYDHPGGIEVDENGLDSLELRCQDTS